MDGRFLSKPNVIKASRNFICVRMMTYESASEAALLKTLWRPDAPLENTVFAILDPEGRSIVRGGRGPNHVFRDAEDMTANMNEISRYYGSSGAVVPKELPVVDTVRLAVDVAACDKRPLVIVVGENEQERKQLAARLAPSAWSDQLIGKLVYTTGSGNDLKAIKGARLSNGYIFVAPGLFGTDGTALMQLGTNASQSELTSASKQTISMFHPQLLSHSEHVRAGKQRGIEWDTAIPVTDPHSLEAQGRGGFGPSGDGPPEGGPPGGMGFGPPNGGGQMGGGRPPGPPPFSPRQDRQPRYAPMQAKPWVSPQDTRQTHVREYR